METTDPEVLYLEGKEVTLIRSEWSWECGTGPGRLPAMSQLAAEAAALVVRGLVANWVKLVFYRLCSWIRDQHPFPAFGAQAGGGILSFPELSELCKGQVENVSSLCVNFSPQITKTVKNSLRDTYVSLCYSWIICNANQSALTALSTS